MSIEAMTKYAYNRLRDDYNDLLKRSEQDAKDAKQWREHVKYCKFQGIDLDYQITTTPTPPAAQRQWVGLTLEDKQRLDEVLNLQGRFPIIDAIEAKLRDKNGGAA